MKKYLVMALLIFSMLALAACNGNGETQDTARTHVDIPSTANVSADSTPLPGSSSDHIGGRTDDIEKLNFHPLSQRPKL